MITLLLAGFIVISTYFILKQIGEVKLQLTRVEEKLDEKKGKK